MFLPIELRKKLTRWISRHAEIYYRQRRYRSARICYRLVSLFDAYYAFALLRLGQIDNKWRDSQSASHYWRRALSFETVHHEAAMAACYELKEIGESLLVEQFLRRYCQQFPSDILSRKLLADVLSDSGRHTEAAQLFTALQHDVPSESSLLLSVAKALCRSGEIPAAIPYFERYLSANSADLSALRQFGNILLSLKDWISAATIWQQALTIDENDPLILTNYGIAQYRIGRFTNATRALVRAIRIAPKAVHPYVNLGVCYVQQGRIAAAQRIFRRGLALPRVPAIDAALQSNALYLTNLMPNATPAEIAEAHRAWGRTMTSLAQPLTEVNKHPQRVLRVGLLSQDFRKHSVFYFLAPLFSMRLPGLELHSYSDVSAPDDCTAWLRARSDQWCDVHTFNDEALYVKIRNDAIDILIDLAGHTPGNRLSVFARRAAPIQITYLGYPNGTGLTTMDYRLTDDRADPPCNDQYYAERLVRLPTCFLCYQAPSEAPPVAPVPMLAQGHVTFGSFNNLAKVNSRTLRVWCNILWQLPDAKLILKSKPLGDAHVRERYRRYFRRQDIDPGRVHLTGWTQDVSHHLASYGAIDIALDSIPYNGTTTTCEALYMGVPVITLAGDSHAGRVGVSLLGQMELSELVAENEELYIQCACSLARTPVRLKNYRDTLRQRLSDSLGNQPRFAQQFALALREIWANWCQS